MAEWIKVLSVLRTYMVEGGTNVCSCSLTSTCMTANHPQKASLSDEKRREGWTTLTNLP